MQIVPLLNIPNQEFNITLDNNDWNITLLTGEQLVLATVIVNKNLLVENVRCVAGALVIPYLYLENTYGNLIFATQNYEEPDYNEFMISQQLIYYTSKELETARTRNSTIITVTDFNPIGALPLRFSPKNYELTP